MKRRSLLKSLGAVGLLPLVPTSTLGALTTVPAGTYKWAETIVRAHNSCNLAMLQRHLKLDLAMAKSVQAQLIRNGIISANANAYGIHAASNPLFRGAFLQSGKTLRETKELAHKVIKKAVSRTEPENAPNCDLELLDHQQEENQNGESTICDSADNQKVIDQNLV